ncbi:hypothetical protein FN846DRAFT_788192 [Sphaerosporella brunnea]|uniref:USP domain-containing protein n=1 Tax=Sphaerosporella brunnea TaxID=1250544 RepID=A0A5J5EDC5_9PEZI|nr:hypothetical protein FN846DRAFT_788192 [Sphaerosporella brunnea]
MDPANKQSSDDDILPHPESFVDCLLLLLRRLSQPPYSGLADVDSCITSALFVLFRACHINPQIWQQISKGPNLRELVQRFLVEDLRPVIRQCMSEAICTLCTEPPRISSGEFIHSFWPILSDIISNVQRLDPRSSHHLFHAAITVFEFLGVSGLQPTDLQIFYRDWSLQLRNHMVNEIVGQSTEDDVIIGFTRLLNRCIVLMHNQGIAMSSQLVDTWKSLLFPDCTFAPSTGSERIPCLHDVSRAELYKLTLELVENHQECLNQIAKFNSRLFPNDETLCDEHWVDRDRWLRAPTGLVGLQNLSNTCYLNSLLTQLFMNRSFLGFVLRLPVAHNDQMRRSSYCLKALFARMQYSFSKALEPRDLVESLRDFAGEPIDPHVQMDVDEFFNLLFDRLESEMPSTEHKSTFRSYYGGHLVQQVKSNECPHISERTEPFSAIQCDIKGKHTLQESLKAYVEGEIMEGVDNKYRCTTCDKLVDAVKRTCLKDIPDHLICHLKRFDFDLQTMHRSKINDRFEFPTKLDMRPYTIDHLSSMESNARCQSDHDVFELVGVLVHTGTAESGHYYSYIRDRLSPVENPIWLEYNDSEVSLFDPSTIPENCFGGGDNVSATGYVLSKSFSAYMLFYQRSSSLQKSHIPSDLDPEPPVPADLRREILKENEQLIKRYSMFSNDYVVFVSKLVQAQFRMPAHTIDNNSSGEDALRLGLRAFEQICSRIKDFPPCDELVSSILDLASRDEKCLKAFFQWASDSNVITTLIIDNPFQEIRRLFIRMLINAMDHLRRTNWLLYGISGTLDDDSDKPLLRKQTILYHVCRGFAEAWNGLQNSFKPWNDYFGFLIEICTWGEDEKDYMLKTGILKKLLEMIVVDSLPTTRRSDSKIENFVRLMNKPRVPLARPAELLSLLMSRCSPYVRTSNSEEARDKLRQDVRLPLTKYEEYCFRMTPPRSAPVLAVFLKLLETTGTVGSMERLTMHLLADETAPAEDELLEMLKNTLLGGISVEPAVHAAPYLRCLQGFVAATKSQSYATDIICKVSEEIPTIGMTGGVEHLQFFQYLWTLDQPGRKVRTHILQYIYQWAPALVVYHDGNVRDAAEDFICDVLFDHPQLPMEIIHQAKFDLANALFQFIRTKLPQNRQPLDENTFTPAMALLEKCREAVDKDEEEQFCSRIEELKSYIDRIVLEEEEDIDAVSDDWGGGSEFGSDTRDVNPTEEFRC